MSTIKVNSLQNTSGNGYYPARAWVNFNGDGTVAIRDDENVASITDNATGNYTVNFSTSLSNANFCCNLSATDSGTASGASAAYPGGIWKTGSTSVVYATSSIRFAVGQSANNGNQDNNFINTSIIGDM
jgi:hypothetical protein